MTHVRARRSSAPRTRFVVECNSHGTGRSAEVRQEGLDSDDIAVWELKLARRDYSNAQAQCRFSHASDIASSTLIRPPNISRLQLRGLSDSDALVR